MLLPAESFYGINILKSVILNPNIKISMVLDNSTRGNINNILKWTNR